MASSFQDHGPEVKCLKNHNNPCHVLPRTVNAEEIIQDNDLSAEVLGISIGSRQVYMRSADTPTIEKTKVLKNHDDYFDGAIDFDGSSSSRPDAITEDSAGRETEEEGPAPTKVSTGVPVTLEARQPSPWKAESSPPRSRLGISRNILADNFSKTRKRAYSGPASIAEQFRKMLPDVSMMFSSKDSAAAESGAERKVGDHTKGGVVAGQSHGDGNRDVQMLNPSSTSSASPRSANDLDRTQVATSGAESMTSEGGIRWAGVSAPKINAYTPRLLSTGNANSRSSLEGNSRVVLSPLATSPPPLRHSNSDSSLFLQRTVSGTSRFEDPSQFADISDMVNSRFKAITDSMQDASLLPKLPKFDFSSLRPGMFDRALGDGMKPNIPQSSTTSPPSQDFSTPTSSNTEDNSRVKANIIEHQRSHPILHEALSKTTGDVIILGGYRGSILRSAEPPHRQLWVPIKVGLNIRKVDLEVGLDREDEIRMPETIFPSGILAHIGPVDIARRLLRHCHKCPNSKSGELRVHNYGYDWRLSPDLLADQLIKALESMQCNTPGIPINKRGAWVIAHSTGGLLTRYAVNKRPELFAGVIYAGVPQACVNILGPLRNGDDVLISSRVLTAQVNFTFRTSFALLPDDGRCFIDKRTGQRYDIDFFDPRTWEEYRLSPCIKVPLPPQRQQRKSIVEAFSDSIPSIPSRPAWLGGRVSTPNQSAAESTKNVVEDTAKDAAANISKVADPEAGANQSLEPSMNSSHPSFLFSSSSSSIKTACTIPYDKAHAYLSRTLAEVREFRKALVFRKEHQDGNVYPPISYIYGKTVPTVYAAKVTNREAIKQSDAYDDLAFAAGDGVVLASMAQLPSGYRCVKGGRVQSERGHVGLLGDLEGVGRALNAVVDARTKGVGLGWAVGEAS